MLNKFIFSIFFIFILSSCTVFDKGGVVNVIIWGNFFEPQKNYESIVHDFYTSGLIDSVKVIGTPFSKIVIQVEIDTIKAKYLNISIDKIQDVIDSIGVVEHLDEFRKFYVKTSDKGRGVPMQAITTIILKSEPFKPRLYLQKPSFFKYKDEAAVKIELYCKPVSKAKLKALIFKTMENYSSEFVSQYWRFEIIKGKLPAD